MVGLPAAGKSTYHRTRFADSHEWISKDRLRNNRHPARRQMKLLGEALAAGRSVVVDNTQPRLADRQHLMELGRSYGARVVCYYYASTPGECIDRNRQRSGKSHVPAVAIYAAAKRLQPPTLAEGFDELYEVRIANGGQFDVAKKGVGGVA